jgi:ribosomal protein L39E
VTFKHKDAPEGFDFVTIVAEPNPQDWRSGEVGIIELDDIRSKVEACIRKKDKLVQAYRTNLPDGAPVWLLLHTGVTVARNMPIPHDIETWRIPFTFDRVFWFDSLEGQFAEIRRGN